MWHEHEQVQRGFAMLKEFASVSQSLEVNNQTSIINVEIFILSSV
jgi:hypothetical protein